VLLSQRESAVDDRLCEVTRRVLGSCEKNYDRALNMLRGKESPAAGLPPVSAVNLLAEALQRIPPDVQVTFSQMLVDLDRVNLRGETDSSRSIDRIAAALKTYRCFREVKEGKVERAKDSSRVSFTLDVQVDCSQTPTGEGGS